MSIVHRLIDIYCRWVVLSLSWFLASGLKWGSEAIASNAHLFHIGAWVLPALGTVAAITDGAVDGDPISGICSVGNQVIFSSSLNIWHLYIYSDFDMK